MEERESNLAPGHKLDRYELLCPIAAGGMAQVWLSRLRGKRGFEKLVAVKTIRTELVDDERFEQMFLDEARIASGIQHPNVAHIMDLGEQDGVLYIVMEYVDGESLAKVRRLAAKRQKPMPLEISLRIMADSCAGLHAAHELKDETGELLGVVHRDVSPQNILVATNGSVKVIDFGVAKARNRGAGETGTGVVKGKIHYMAPEQAQGKAVDRRVDIWAIGVCLHQLVTGKLPFDDDSEMDVIRRLIGNEPVVRPEGIAIPEAIEAILSHSLARNPDERFATAAAMQRALETAIDELGLTCTSEDVADYVRAAVPELATQRRQTVTDATAKAAERDEVALAATVVSQRPQKLGGGDAGPAGPAGAAGPATSRDPAAARSSGARGEAAGRERSSTQVSGREGREARDARSASPAPLAREESKLTLQRAALASSDDIEAAGLPKRRLWLWALVMLMLGGGGWYGWKNGGVEKVRGWLAAAGGGAPQSNAAPAAPSSVADVAPSAPSSAPVDAAAPLASAARPDAGARMNAPWKGGVGQPTGNGAVLLGSTAGSTAPVATLPASATATASAPEPQTSATAPAPTDTATAAPTDTVTATPPAPTETEQNPY